MGLNKFMPLPLLSLTVLLTVGFAGSVLAGTPEAPCTWMTGTAVTDGNLDEWKEMPTTFFKDERLVLGVSNDSDFLYLFFRSDNLKTIQAIQMSGISIWLDRKGKKKKDLCYHFRGGPSMEEMKEAGLIDAAGFEERINKQQHQMMTERMGQTRNKITITDKDLDLEQVIPIDGTFGPTLSYDFDGRFCVYEFSIPLQDHLVDYFGFNAVPGQKVGIGAKWGGRPKHMDDDHPGGIGVGMGGSGSMAGGRKGGMRGGPAGRMKSPESKEIWAKTVLAVPVADKQTRD